MDSKDDFSDKEEDFDEKESKDKDNEGEQEEDSQAPNTILDSVRNLLCSPVLADVWFQVGTAKPERIPAHRLILAANNDVFRALLFPLQFTEDGKAHYVPVTDEKDIAIPEVEPAHFKQMLEAIYTDHVTIEQGDIKNLVPLATRYQVDSLRAACAGYLEDDLTIDTAVKRFEEGRALLQEASFGLAFIEENASEVFKSEEWADISREGLKIILSSDRLSAEEVEVFNALNVWAASECRRNKLEVTPDNKRNVLGDLLDLVRFPLMAMEDVVAKVNPSGLLKAEDLLSLFTFLGATKDKKPKVRWNAKPRVGGGFLKESKILDKKASKALEKMCAQLKGKWVKIYDGKKHGFMAQNFHTQCDNKQNTLTIIKSTNGNVFGGFTAVDWNITNNYKMDPKAFLFSLVNSRNNPVKFRCNQPNYAIYTANSQGPTWGSGHNIYLAQYFNQNSNYCQYNAAYMPEDGSTYDQNFMAGSYNFTVAEIECFHLQTKK